MKKNFYFLLMAALVCSLSLSVTSCKDDDKNDDNGGGESGENLGPQNEQNEVATKFWSVVGELVDMDEFTEDYKSATFSALPISLILMASPKKQLRNHGATLRWVR